MNNPGPSKKSLRILVGVSFLFVAWAVMSSEAFLIYSGQQNTRSIDHKKELEFKYDSAIDLRMAIDSLVYFSAEMSNSLSDESLDNFEAAALQAEKLIVNADDVSFKQALLDQKDQIESNALSALDAYIIDDRAAGDAFMAKARENAANLKLSMTEHVDRVKLLRDQESQAIKQRSLVVEKTSMFFALLTIGILLFVSILMWNAFFVPVRGLAKAISNAANDTSNAADYQLVDLPNNEIGSAGAALNQLLKSVSSAISDARVRALDAKLAEEKWKALFEGSPDAIILLDPQSGDILDFNPSTQQLLCMEQKNVLAKSRMNGFDIHHHEIDNFKNFLNSILSNGFARSDILSCAIDDQRIPVSVVGVSAPFEDRTVALLHVRDISAQRRHEEELSEALVEAERANEAKGNFLANMSHEIRTPMNGIIGMTEILGNTELEPKQKKFLDIISSSSGALLSVINDVLEISKIDANGIEFENKPFNMKAMVESVLGMIVPRADAKEIEIIFRYGADTSEVFLGDEGRIRQIMVNLIGNAVKFTETGHVFVDVEGANGKNPAGISFTITDTGIGIPKDKLGSIFEKFNQVDNSSTRKFEGTGLGLAISRMLVEQMGGEISVDSTLGEGTAFVICLPLEADLSDDAVEHTSAVLKGTRALIIDDNALTREILAEQLVRWGASVTSCAAANEGLTALRDSQSSKEPYDIIICDYQMPELDGLDAVQTIRSENLSEDSAIILLAAVGDEQVYKDCDDGKFDAILTKPVFSLELKETVAACISEKRLTSLKAITEKLENPIENPIENQADQKAIDAAAQSVKVLVVEDNETNQLVLGTFLTSLGYIYDVAGDGKQGFEEFKRGQHDIILMDISMPVMNGYEATAEIRRFCKENGGQPAIIALTANALPGDRQKCLSAGMDDYIAKPVKMNDIAEGISRFSNQDVRKQG